MPPQGLHYLQAIPVNRNLKCLPIRIDHVLHVRLPGRGPITERIHSKPVSGTVPGTP